MHLDDGMDLVALMFWLIVGLMSTVFCFGVVAKNMKPYTLPDKSAITAISDNTPDPYQWYVRDYLLMLMVADEFCPEPKAIDIQFGNGAQDTLIEINDEFLKNMEGRLQRYYIRYLNTRVDQPISSYEYYYEGEGEKGRWRFHTEY